MSIRVLLVDDNDALLETLSTILELQHMEVSKARSVSEALQLLGMGPFDLVITDVRMETQTAGFEVVQAARSLTPRPAIAILTAFPIPAGKWKSMGADALISKGEGVSLLCRRFLELLGPEAHRIPAAGDR